MSYLDFPADIPQPSYGSSDSLKYKVTRSAFGDGYEQTSAKGLNNSRREWSLSWSALRTEDKDALRAFVETTGGFRAFYWTPPLETEPSIWRIKEDSYSESPIGPDGFDVSMTFYRVIR